MSCSRSAGSGFLTRAEIGDKEIQTFVNTRCNLRFRGLDGVNLCLMEEQLLDSNLLRDDTIRVTGDGCALLTGLHILVLDV